MNNSPKNIEAESVAKIEVNGEDLKAVKPLFQNLDRIISICSWASLILFVWVLNYNKIQSNDTWIHLRLGQWMVETKQFITQDFFSATINGKPFVAHEWLSFILFYLIADKTGSTLTYFKIIVAMAVAIGYGGMLWRRYRDYFITLPALALLAYMYCFRVHERPMLFGNLCVATIIMTLDYWRRNPKSKIIWAFVPLQMFWVNVHGSFMFGPIFLGIAAAAELLARTSYVPAYFQKNRLALTDIKMLLAVMGAMLLASLVNPYGFEMIQHTFGMFFGHSYLKENILEWQSITEVSLENYWYLGWIVWLCATWYVTFRNKSSWSLTDFAMLSAATYMPFSGMRYVTISTIIMTPLFFKHATAVFAAPARPRMFLWAILPLTAYIAIVGTPYSAVEHKPIGVGFNIRQVPFDIIDFIKRKELKGSIMTNYEEGSYIAYYLYPNVKDVIDARTDLYGDEKYNEHRLAFYTLQNFRAYLTKYKIDMVLLKSIPNFDVLRQDLLADPEWRLDMIGFSHALFSRKATITIPPDSTDLAGNSSPMIFGPPPGLNGGPSSIAGLGSNPVAAGVPYEVDPNSPEIKAMFAKELAKMAQGIAASGGLNPNAATFNGGNPASNGAASSTPGAVPGNTLVTPPGSAQPGSNLPTPVATNASNAALPGTSSSASPNGISQVPAANPQVPAANPQVPAANPQVPATNPLAAPNSAPVPTNSAVSAPSVAAKPANEAFCVIGRALGHCDRLKACDAICKLTADEFTKKVPGDKPWCQNFVRTCSDKHTACQICPSVCAAYGQVIGDLNKELSLAYPGVSPCGQ